MAWKISERNTKVISNASWYNDGGRGQGMVPADGQQEAFREQGNDAEFAVLGGRCGQNA